MAPTKANLCCSIKRGLQFPLLGIEKLLRFKALLQRFKECRIFAARYCLFMLVTLLHQAAISVYWQ